MMRTQFTFLFTASLLLQAKAQQPMVDLTMSDNGRGQVEVRLRTDGYFDEVASALTFTLRWPAIAGIALDTAVRCYPFQDVMPVNASAPIQSGQFIYRTFNGFGVSLLSDFGLAWQEGIEYPICTADILVPGTTIELVNDAFTDGDNRSFYCSLGGYDRTGVYFASPEPIVDITSLNQGTGNLDVILTPADDFFGWVTDLNFTVRWPTSSGVHLAALAQPADVAEYLPIEKVGAEVVSGAFTYQVFHGEGVKSIANSASAWLANEDRIVLSVPIIGSTEEIRIVNDAWTAGHEGDYLIELNGHGRAGTIDGVAVGINALNMEILVANVLPTDNGFIITLDLPQGSAPLELALHNAAGQSIWNASHPRAGERYSTVATTGNTPEGLYILSVLHGDRTLTKRIIR